MLKRGIKLFGVVLVLYLDIQISRRYFCLLLTKNMQYKYLEIGFLILETKTKMMIFE